MGRKAKTGLLDLIPEEFLRRTKTFVLRLVLSLAVVTILCCCFVILRNYVARLECHQVDARTLVPKALPSWATERMCRELACLPGIPARFSIMEPGICRRVAGAFEANPWVEEVISVRKVQPNRITVQMRLRRPVAAVRVRRQYYMVDAEGRRLTPAIDTWPEASADLPVILASTYKPPKLGEQWDSEGVKAGAAVARHLLYSRERIGARFVAIDVTNIGGRRNRYESDIVLITRKGTRVKWGRSPLLVNPPGELTPAQKISKMILFEKKRGPLSNFRYVDIRFDNAQHGPRTQMVSDLGR